MRVKMEFCFMVAYNKTSVRNFWSTQVYYDLQYGIRNVSRVMERV